MWTSFHQESMTRWNLNGSLCSAAQSVISKFPPSGLLDHVKFVTNPKQTISHYCQRAIGRVHEDHIVMKAQVRKRQFLRVQVTVKVWRACNPSHYIRLNLACQLNGRCTSMGRNCTLLFSFPLSDEASWHIHIVFMHCFEPQYLCLVYIVPLRVIMSLWLNDVVFTRYYVQHLNVSDYLWPIHSQSWHGQELESIWLPLNYHRTFTVLSLCSIFPL